MSGGNRYRGSGMFACLFPAGYTFGKVRSDTPDHRTYYHGGQRYCSVEYLLVSLYQYTMLPKHCFQSRPWQRYVTIDFNMYTRGVWALWGGATTRTGSSHSKFSFSGKDIETCGWRPICTFISRARCKERAQMAIFITPHKIMKMLTSGLYIFVAGHKVLRNLFIPWEIDDVRLS